MEKSCQSLPFGDGETCLATPTEHLFTGKERDAESGNDYFEARYYSSAVGRFMSPDWSAKVEPVPYADLENLQSLNLYAYVGNNPLTHVDADGHCWPWGWVCSVGQAIGNAFTGHCFFCTDTQLNNRTEARRKWLNQHAMVINSDGSTVDWQKADRKTIDHWYGQAINADANIPRLPIPPVPEGLSGPGEFGKKMGWGTGRPAKIIVTNCPHRYRKHYRGALGPVQCLPVEAHRNCETEERTQGPRAD
jgi:RHS repeat-associated protein